MKIVPNFLITLIALVFVSAECFAAPEPPPPQVIPPVGVPIDGSIEILVIVAIFFAFYKVAIFKNKQNV